MKKLLNITRNKNKHKILMLAKSKLNSIETLISQALTEMEISHEEFITILKEKDKYDRMKDNLRSESEKYVSNDTSCKATCKIKDLKLLNAFFKKIAFQCTCLTDTSCFATYKNGIILFKV